MSDIAREIDPKFHIEVEFGKASIVKTSNGELIPDDEPLILFRARDRLATAMLRYYRELCEADGCTEFQMEGIDNRIAAFAEFYQKHPERMKQPGSTRGL